MGDWRSGSAGALHAQGQRFKSVIAHHKTAGQRLVTSDFFDSWCNFLAKWVHNGYRDFS